MIIRAMLVLSIILVGISAYPETNFNFPEYTEYKSLSPKLKIFKDQLSKSKIHEEQNYLVRLIALQPDAAKYDILMDEAVLDLKSADTYGTTHRVFLDVRVFCISNTGISADPKYLRGYWHILQFDTSLETRMNAAYALGEVSNACQMRIFLVNR